jgi:hypothetical protein
VSLVDDPELRFTSSGVAVANLRVAVTQRIQQDREWRDGDTSRLNDQPPFCSRLFPRYPDDTCSAMTDPFYPKPFASSRS